MILCEKKSVAEIRAFEIFRYVLFVYTCLGRGLFYFFCGTLMLYWGNIAQLIMSIVVMLVGAIYIFASPSTKGIPKPLSHRGDPPELAGRPKWINGSGGPSGLNLSSMNLPSQT
eukprot:Filipodium_phascolosomae@DN8653_c0_g1_i1.p1